MRRATGCLVVSLAFFSPGTLAVECQPGASHPEVTLADQMYLDVDFCPGECTLPAYPWLYAESNGVTGLQRNDDLRDDTCGGLYPSDTLII